MIPIIILLADQYSDWEIAPLAGVGRAFYGADIRFASVDGEPVTSVAGLHIGNLPRFQAPAEGVVVVCGGPAYEGTSPPDISDELRKAYDNGCTIAGICGGTIALARAGLLDDVRHTSNGPGYLDKLAEGYAGTRSYVDQPYALRDGRIVTAAAPQPATFAREVLIAAGLEPEKANQIPQMLSAEHGPGGRKQAA